MVFGFEREVQGNRWVSTVAWKNPRDLFQFFLTALVSNSQASWFGGFWSLLPGVP
jgi:hypothetical protein